MILAEKVASLRKKEGWSQEELAYGKKMVLGIFWAVAAFLYVAVKKLLYVVLEKGTK